MSARIILAGQARQIVQWLTRCLPIHPVWRAERTHEAQMFKGVQFTQRQSAGPGVAVVRSSRHRMNASMLTISAEKDSPIPIADRGNQAVSCPLPKARRHRRVRPWCIDPRSFWLTGLRRQAQSFEARTAGRLQANSFEWPFRFTGGASTSPPQRKQLASGDHLQSFLDLVLPPLRHFPIDFSCKGGN